MCSLPCGRAIYGRAMGGRPTERGRDREIVDPVEQRLRSAPGENEDGGLRTLWTLCLDDERSERRDRHLELAVQVNDAVDHGGAVPPERLTEGVQRVGSNRNFVRLVQVVVDGSIYRLVFRERLRHALLDRVADSGKHLQERPIHTIDTFRCLLCSGRRRVPSRGPRSGEHWLRGRGRRAGRG